MNKSALYVKYDNSFSSSTHTLVQENGVAVAIEAIYRDLEYARSLVKGIAHQDHRDLRAELFDAEHATIRDFPSITPPEHPSPSGSATGPPVTGASYRTRTNPRMTPTDVDRPSPRPGPWHRFALSDDAFLHQPCPPISS